MSFNYDTIRAKKQSSGTQWASYSDLFMVLAFIFLLLYMVASLRTGMISITTHAQLQEAKQELHLYESIKNQYLAEQASAQEKRIYQEILGQISLLEDEANEKKKRLAQEYNEQEQRGSALNRYQQMIKIMINATTIAKADASKIISFEKQQNEELSKNIRQQSNDLASLEDKLKKGEVESSMLEKSHSNEIKTLKNKNQSLKSNNDKRRDEIASLESDIKTGKDEIQALIKTHSVKISSLKDKYQNIKVNYNKRSIELVSLEKQLKADKTEISTLKNRHTKKTKNLERKYKELERNLGIGQGKLVSIENKLKTEKFEMAALKKIHSEETKRLEGKYLGLKGKHAKGQEKITSLEDKVESEKSEMSALKLTHSMEVKDLENKYNYLKGDHDASLNELSALESEIKSSKNKMSKIEKTHADKLKGLEKKYKGLKENYDNSRNQVSKLNSDLNKAEDNLKNTSKDLGIAKANLESTSEGLGKAQADLERTSKDLAKALKMASRRKDLAKRIKDNFKDHGIDAFVDAGTGDVVLDFGEDYFDYNSHDLKPGMEQTIRRAIPVYAQSLFAKESLASKISSVEIIGFASPTFAGKPVNPVGLSAENRIAVNYNLDLSYKRAKSIFEYVFDTVKIKFNHQNTMLPLIKVTGRSFFTEKIDLKHTGNLSKDEFCKQYNCSKSQRVIIKFGLSE